MIPDDRLTLIGQSPADLPAISALIQDATLRIADVGFDRRHRRLALLVNRYRWEAGGGSRVRCALRLETVLAVQRLRWPTDADAVLNLLSIAPEGDYLVITCAGGAALRARVEVIDLILEDIAAPWETARRPDHRDGTGV